ncbi:MAG: alpha/beta fold hydrolase [Clostridiaceae bacterium]|nr:alpha/beta fold hydrolase [Clostridiaceae bacterium]
MLYPLDPFGLFSTDSNNNKYDKIDSLTKRIACQRIEVKMDTNRLDCATKYPVVLVHGTGFRDRKWFNYWGRIPTELKSRGCDLYYGNQDSWATVENNAMTIQSRIREIIAETGAKKVNIIAHSKGGMEARYMISTLGMADYIASLTTISTPHHGSKTMDIACKLPGFMFGMAAFFANRWFKLLGDRNPDFHFVCRQFTTGYAEEFNRENVDSDAVYYQSYAGVMRNSLSDGLMFFPHWVVCCIEGENDGLVTPGSAMWGDFKGILKGCTNRGISHADEVDMRRRKFTSKSKEGFVSDICDVYVQIVMNIKRLGY